MSLEGNFCLFFCLYILLFLSRFVLTWHFTMERASRCFESFKCLNIYSSRLQAWRIRGYMFTLISIRKKKSKLPYKVVKFCKKKFASNLRHLKFCVIFILESDYYVKKTWDLIVIYSNLRKSVFKSYFKKSIKLPCN